MENFGKLLNKDKKNEAFFFPSGYDDLGRQIVGKVREMGRNDSRPNRET